VAALLAATALLSSTACGSGGARGDREDAASYARAAQQFLGAQDRAGGEAFNRVRGALDRCPPSVGGRTRLLVSQEAEEFLVPVGGQLALPGYRKLTAALASVDAHDDGLREIAEDAATVAGEDVKFANSDFDFCRFLEAWEAASWSTAFPDAYFVRLCRDAGYGRDAVARAEARIQDDVVALARLGLSSKQQLDLYTSLLSPLFAVCNADR
jgi:hypothetical protein